MSAPLHGDGALPRELGELVADFVRRRIGAAPVGRTAAPSELIERFRTSITAAGLGPAEAWNRFEDDVVANCVGLDSERYLAFIPVAPSAAGVWMDAALGAATFSAESWLEASGAVAAENAVLDWLATVLGMPAGSGGCFMSGGSIGNLSALAVARESVGPGRAVAIADTAHASVANSLALLGMRDVLVVPTAGDGRLNAVALTEAAAGRSVGVVVAAAGSTNAGVVDDLDGLADWCGAHCAWLHVDAAYGGAAVLVDELRDLFRGIGRADSVIIDPHKWLFSPQGSCALLYRDPAVAARVHTQRGPYLDILHGDEPLWNPSDYGFQLTRRASGLTLWFALAVHGVDAHADAVRVGVSRAAYAAHALASTTGVDVVMPPELGVVLFRRAGWAAADWRAWAHRLLHDGIAFVAPTTWRGEVVGRLVFLHPRTSEAIVDEVVGSLAG